MYTALQDARIRGHHNLVTLLRGRLGQASPQQVFHQEMSTASLQAPLGCRDEWQRAKDDMSDVDLDGDGDPARTARLLRKRQVCEQQPYWHAIQGEVSNGSAAALVRQQHTTLNKNQQTMDAVVGDKESIVGNSIAHPSLVSLCSSGRGDASVRWQR